MTGRAAFTALLLLAAAGNSHSEEIDFYGENRSRYYAVDTFAASADNDYEFGANQLRLGARHGNPWLDAHAAVQYTQLSNLPASTSAGAGAGSLYFANADDRNPGSLYLKYLHIDSKELGGTGVALSAGRFDYASGNNYRTGSGKGLEEGDRYARESKQVRWLKSQRVSERLIGGFEWSEFQRSFDGAKVSWDSPRAHVQTAAMRPTQGGFEDEAGDTMWGIGLAAVEATLKKDVNLPNAELQFFHYYYGDERALLNRTARPDNSGLSVPAGEEIDVRVHTMGGHAAGAVQAGEALYDYLFWGAYQAGDWYGLDHRAFAVAAEGGVQFDGIPWEPWLRFGYNAGSGDSGASDGKHETFFPMLPTARLYSWSILYNGMNNEDVFGMLILKPAEPVTARMDVHRIRVMESADLWYLGSGAVESGRDIGYAARPTLGGRDLGILWDIQLTWKIHDNLSLTGYYGHFFGDEIPEAVFPHESDSDFAFLECAARF